MDIKTFTDKYDSGDGYGWSCGDCGFNKAGNREIYPSEVKAAVDENAYDEVAADFRSLDAELSKQTVAGYFKDELAYEVAQRLDPKYTLLRNTFDNGDSAKAEDDIYTLSEVNSKGGIKVFKAEIAKLDPDAQIFISGRATDEVFALMRAGAEEVFWATYGGEDQIIDGAEVTNVEGSWNRFWTDLKELYAENPTMAENVLNRLRGTPPAWVLADIKKLFPAYTDPYNLKQFPVMGASVYYNTQLGLRTIQKLTGRDVGVISGATLPGPTWPLAVNSQEQFYMDLVSHLSTMPAGYKMDVEAFGNFVARNFNNAPRATLAKLVQGANENISRYLGVQYTIPLATMIDVVGEPEEVGEQTALVKAKDRGLIDKLTAMRFKNREGDSNYTFYLPVVKVEYGTLACDTGTAGAVACLPLGFDVEFPQFEVVENAYSGPGGAIRFEYKIIRNKFNKPALERILSRPGGLTVNVVKKVIDFDMRLVHDWLAAIPQYSLELVLNEGWKDDMIDSEVFYSGEYTYHPPKPKPPKPPKPQDPPWPQDPEDPGPGDEDSPTR